MLLSNGMLTNVQCCIDKDMLWFNINGRQDSIPWTQWIKRSWLQGEGEFGFFGEKGAFLLREEGGSLGHAVRRAGIF